MKNRFRIEIYDDIKANDVTIFADNNVDRELLSEYVFGNIRNFNTTVHAYVYDTLKKKKTAALFLPMETVQKIQSKMSYPSELFA